eukprot:Blabericola_migrator_1__2175@NODE_15_length_23605_cov_67_423868_g12_i0_p3_GENE_NODE_15_length_23605_cov_67_423868_g12_i0NODE_15_length_23605_cov_67_423868_g12_i0_p3_ORF_typecomplete_len815_score130_25UCH/PF00443_29/6_8e28UBA/PF00627_31/1_7e02UBA/PF00627_31/1_6e08zfUBP/PF02148_19/3e09zfUBP/PF02148_19/3_4e03UCH_1/PF13423_6/1_8e03UCH_1/PF13423_6/2_6e05UBA_5/PF16577_5/4_5e02UBA_5/PF16577_5/0_067UBA_4/PF14555_6/0_02HOIPUBA/PF16678_5/0_15_NODE_15_length_23605_cov_67_423868_g12_i01099913443
MFQWVEDAVKHSIALNKLSGSSDVLLKLINISKNECIYSASQSIKNSVDDIHVTETGVESCVKSLYLNLGTIKLVSKRWINHDSVATQRDLGLQPVYLESRRRKTWKSDESLKTEIETAIKVQDDVAGGSSATQALSSGCLYEETITYHLTNIAECVDLPQNPNAWTSVVSCEAAQFLKSLSTSLETSKAMGIENQIFDADEVPTVVEDLHMVSEPTRVPSSGWRCQTCGKSSNLWLNLCDGFIGCGRRQYGVENSGCTEGRQGAAICHYEEHPDRHVCVKLGTLTATSVECYSYKLDKFVMLPKLDEYLTALGLSRANLQQTEMSIKELAIEKNQKLQLGLPSSEEERSRQAFGSGLVGMTNIGNTCYIASLCQILAVILSGQETEWNLYQKSDEDPDQVLLKWLEKHHLTHEALLRDVEYQLLRLLVPLICRVNSIAVAWAEGYTKRHQSLTAKFGERGMRTMATVDPNFDCGCPSPFYLKRVVGRQYPQFSSGCQQDVEEFYDCLMSMLKSKGHNVLHNLLGLTVQEKKRLQNGNYRISTHGDVSHLVLDMNNYKDSATPVAMTEFLKEWNSTQGIKHCGRWLLVEVRRLTATEAYEAVKINTPVVVPESLDTASLQPPELLPGEVEDAEGNPSQPFSSEIREQLLMFGFTEIQIKAAAALMDRSTPPQVEAIVNWICEHPDAQAPASGAPDVDPEKLMLVVSMGFNEEDAKRALNQTNGDVDAALDKLFGGDTMLETNVQSQPSVILEGPARFCLTGAITHLGSHAHSGHYVVHLKKAGGWYLFNDTVVSKYTETPDLGLGYMFLYRRED